jgi:hypothetical protein
MDGLAGLAGRAQPLRRGRGELGDRAKDRVVALIGASRARGHGDLERRARGGDLLDRNSRRRRVHPRSEGARRCAGLREPPLEVLDDGRLGRGQRRTHPTIVAFAPWAGGPPDVHQRVQRREQLEELPQRGL